jgi:PilZ domain-containing protein
MRYSRLAKRIAVTGEASVRWVLTEDSDDGTLLDVSRKGARLRINHLFQRGQKLTLMLNLPWDKPPVEVRLAAVKWVQANTVGVEFLKVEDEDRVSLDVFLASRSKLPASSPAWIANFAARGGPKFMAELASTQMQLGYANADQPAANSRLQKLCGVWNSHFFHHIGAVSFDCLDADLKALSYLLILETGPDQFENFLLPRREWLWPFSPWRRLYVN